MSLLRATGVTVKAAGRVILSNVDMEVMEGEIITIVGPNGSGKSTLLRALIGAVPVASGQVEKQAGLNIGYVPQKLHVDPTLPLTVRGFVNLPRVLPAKEFAALLGQVGLAGFEGAQMASLSGGQFQRALLARALAVGPDVLLMDEPTQGLDQPGTADFYALISRIRDETGMAILMVSHDLHVVMSRSDRVICLNGHVCCHGTPEVVSTAPEYQALFGRGTHGELALYRHEHDHSHHGHGHDHGHNHGDGPNAG